MTRFPREDYRSLALYDPGRMPVTLDLSDNTNLWGPHPAALEAIRNSPPEALSRYPSVYGSDLKAAVAEKYGVPPENVVTGCGSDDLLDSAFRASAVPPGRLIYPSPSFSMVETFARMNGMEAQAVEWKKAEVDPARILLEEPDLVYLCRPNNPTGASLPRDWIMGLLALGGMDGPLVVLDEAYSDFAGDSFIHDAVESGRLLVLRTLSKLFGLAGLRVGFGVGTREVVEEVEKSRGPYKVSHVAERAAVAGLQDQSGWAEGVAEEARQNRARLAQELESRGLAPLHSDANFLLVPVEPANAAEVNRALRDHGVAARPFPGLPGVGDALRVTVGPWDMMEGFLSALDQLMVPGPETGQDE